MLNIRQINKQLEPLKNELINHSLYKHLNTPESINKFMEIHSFAVWDFMLLVKHLQINLTSIQFPWKPTANAEVRRFINEIVLAEESDVDMNGNAVSHFELYLNAMKESNCQTDHIETFINTLPEINTQSIDSKIATFINFTINAVNNMKLHEVAAIFTFGRENLIPDMFTEIVKGLNNQFGHFDTLIYYLERHIELDADDHGPIALRMISELCGSDETKWIDALTASKAALEHRIALWDYIEKEILNISELQEV